MKRQHYGLKVWNVNGLSEKKASDDLLQNEIRKYDIPFLGETWQYKENLDNLHHPLGYFHDFVFKDNFNKKDVPRGLHLFVTVVSCKEKFQSIIYLKISFGLR